MTKFANEHSYKTWGELMYDSHEHSQIEYTKKAMLIYAGEVVKNLPQAPVINQVCILHSTDWYGKCFTCGEQVFTRDE